MEDKNLSNLGVIKEILKDHGLFLTKSLGQNFLINPFVCPRIAELGGAKDSFVLEVGAGIGVLTKELSKLAKKVCSVEIDKRLIPILNDTLSEFDNIEIISEDILNLDLEKLLKEKANGMNIKVCANLPYYITSPILMHILESKLPIESITVMVQKEAAKRICAKPGTRDCGSISLAVSYYSTPKLLFNVSRGSFYPKPNVDSAVIKLDINKVKPVNVYSEKDFFELIKAAFSQRRKVLINPVSKLWNVSKKELKKKLISLDIDPSARAEQLSLKQFADISNSKYDLTSY